MPLTAQSGEFISDYTQCIMRMAVRLYDVSLSPAVRLLCLCENARLCLEDLWDCIML